MTLVPAGLNAKKLDAASMNALLSSTEEEKGEEEANDEEEGTAAERTASNFRFSLSVISLTSPLRPMIPTIFVSVPEPVESDDSSESELLRDKPEGKGREGEAAEESPGVESPDERPDDHGHDDDDDFDDGVILYDSWGLASLPSPSSAAPSPPNPPPPPLSPATTPLPTTSTVRSRTG
jgi:hypothetical protein